VPFQTVRATTARVFPPSTLPGIVEGDWIEISVGWNAGRRQRVESAGNKSIYDPAVGRFVITGDVFARRLALAQDVVVAWSDPTPVTPEVLRDNLDPAVHDWICNEFDRLSAGRSEDAEKNSGTASSPGPSAAQTSPANSGT